jgi:hypothetical protein
VVPVTPADPRRFSADGNWWWDGWHWLPAFTPDRLWRFTGERWVPAQAARRPPQWLIVSGLGWLAGLVGWLLYAAVLVGISDQGDPGRPALYVLVGLAGVAVLATVGWGFLVGRRRASRWLWQAGGLGTAALMFSYVVAMVAAPASDDPAESTPDTAAGAGVAVLTVPTAVIILALLWFGAGLGALSRRISHGRQPTP